MHGTEHSQITRNLIILIIKIIIIIIHRLADWHIFMVHGFKLVMAETIY